MSGKTTEKLHSGFLRRAYSTFHRADGGNVNRSEALLRGIAYSFSAAFSSWKGSYAELSERYNIGYATVARAVPKLAELGDVDVLSRGSRGTEYKYTGKIALTAPFIRTDNYLFFEEFEIDGTSRKLKKSEIDVLSLIKTHTTNKKKDCFDGSLADVAGILGLSVRTVGRVLRSLLRADLIHRSGKGINLHKKSTFRANMKLFRYLDKKHNKTEEAETPNVSTVAVLAEMEAEKRAEYYKKLEAEEDDRIRRVERLLMEKGDSRVKEATEGLRRAVFQRATFELRGQEKQLVALDEKCREWKLIQIEALRVLGYPADALERRVRCRTCNDTGQRADGTSCECWKF